MRVPDAGDILRVWEEGIQATPTQRSVSLLAAAFPDRPLADLIDIGVGRRDAWLIVLRQALIGDQASGQASCPECSEQVVFDFDVSAFQLDEKEGSWRLVFEGYEVEYRVITVRDLLRLGRTRDIHSARGALVRAAVIRASLNGLDVHPDELPDTVVEAVGEAIGEEDPQSEVRVRMACPTCGHQWSVAFDIASFLYRELSARAEGTLHEINLLARVYGWSETAILAMTPSRRRAYLQMAER